MSYDFTNVINADVWELFAISPKYNNSVDISELNVSPSKTNPIISKTDIAEEDVILYREGHITPQKINNTTDLLIKPRHKYSIHEPLKGFTL